MIPSPTSNIRSRIGHLAPVVGRWSLVIGYCSLLLLLGACARPDHTWERVLETGILRVGMDASFPPFETVTADGTLVGFDVDLARELGRRLGAEVQFVANLPYDGLYDALTVARVDVVISALVVNPARMADFAYSTPYFDAGQVLVACQGKTGIEERCTELAEGASDDPAELVEFLRGCTVAVELGTRGDQEARKWARKQPSLTVVPYQTAAEALAAVAARQADVALVDHVSALAVTAPARTSEPGTECGMSVAGAPVIEEPYAVAVHRHSQHMLRAINQALAEMEADGTIAAMRAEWLQ